MGKRIEFSFSGSEETHCLELSALGESNYRVGLAEGDAEETVALEPLLKEGAWLCRQGEKQIKLHSYVDEKGTLWYALNGSVFQVKAYDPRQRRGGGDSEGGGKVALAPMNGLLSNVMVEVGASVSAGDPLFGVEAMKMENVVRAKADAVVKAINAEVGVQVEGEQVIIEFE